MQLFSSQIVTIIYCKEYIFVTNRVFGSPLFGPSSFGLFEVPLSNARAGKTPFETVFVLFQRDCMLVSVLRFQACSSIFRENLRYPFERAVTTTLRPRSHSAFMLFSWKRSVSERSLLGRFASGVLAPDLKHEQVAFRVEHRTASECWHAAILQRKYRRKNI